MRARRHWRRIVQLVSDGKLNVVIDRVFPLSAAAAQRRLAGRNQFGKVLLHP